MLNDVVNVDSDSGDSSIISSTTFSSSTSSSSSCSESESSLSTDSISSDTASISSVSTMSNASSFNGNDEEALARDTFYGRDPALIAEIKSIEQKLHGRDILSIATQRTSNVDSSTAGVRTLKAVSEKKDSIIQQNLTSTYFRNRPEDTVLGKEKDSNSQSTLTATYPRNGPNGSTTPNFLDKLQHQEGISSFLDSKLG
eukprot:GSChrysophyteH1.ASY1.ANO1.1858.1 assembled CDS